MRTFYVADEQMINQQTIDPVIVVAAGGEIDYAASPQLRDLLAAATTPECPPVLVDLSDATFIDSTAIGVLVGAAASLSEFGSQMAIVCADEQVTNIFGIVGLDEMINIYSSRAEALGAFSALR